jgi:hypothetical protein
MIDDLSINGAITVYRRIQPRYFSFDNRGDPVMSDGAFRTNELSRFRCDRVSETEVLDGYPSDGLAEITVQAIRDAGCLVVTAEPPPGHLCAYKRDAPGSRISSGAALKMARAGVAPFFIDI